MNRREEILIEYEKADTNKRLHLYLQFRDLRGDFMEIERKESKCLAFTNSKVLKPFLNAVYSFAPGRLQTLKDGTRTCVLDLNKDVETMPRISRRIRDLRKTGLMRIEREEEKFRCWIEPDVFQRLARILPQSFCG